ncbi:hypothetical protein CRUP_017190, partial [Coryphaenoides rupestris]
MVAEMQDLPPAKVPILPKDILNSRKALAGPCRRKLDGIIQGMKDTSRVMALSLYLPNCDRKGFFKRKQ